MSIHPSNPRVRVLVGRASNGVEVYEAVFEGPIRDAHAVVRAHAGAAIRVEVFLRGQGWVPAAACKAELEAAGAEVGR